jgi:hypothetical protein
MGFGVANLLDDPLYCDPPIETPTADAATGMAPSLPRSANPALDWLPFGW